MPSQQEQEMVEKIQQLLQAEKTQEAFRQLALVPKWIKNSPFHTLLRATALIQSGDMDAGGEILRDLERKNPNFTPLYLTLANWYMSQEWPAHALRAVKKVLDSSSPDTSFMESAERLAEVARAAIQFLADHENISESMAEKAEWHNEQAQLSLLDENFVEVEHQARLAIQIAPHWTSPRNNLVHVLYMMGKCPEAIADQLSPHHSHGEVIFKNGICGNLSKNKNDFRL